MTVSNSAVVINALRRAFFYGEMHDLESLDPFCSDLVGSLRHNCDFNRIVCYSIKKREVVILQMLVERGLLLPFPIAFFSQPFEDVFLNNVRFLIMTGFPGEVVSQAQSLRPPEESIMMRLQSALLAYRTHVADVNFRDSEGNTPLMYACRYLNAAFVKELLNFGADPYSRNTRGRFPIHFASIAGRTDVVSLLMRHGVDVNFCSTDGSTPLLLAASMGRLNLCQFLCEAGANISAARDSGWTPLLIAATFGKIDVCRYLVQRGADVNAPCKYASPLHSAVSERRVAVCEFLVQAGASLSTCDSSGQQPLHIACRKGFLPIVSFLIEHGASMDNLDHRGCTPLHLAIFNDHLEVVAFLVSSGIVVSNSLVDSLTLNEVSIFIFTYLLDCVEG